MRSVYDTLVLVTGIITAVIAILPVDNIPAGTRAKSAAIGGGLIVLALFLGSLRSFRYPSIVFLGPFIALTALGAIVANARKRTTSPGLQPDEQSQRAPASGIAVSLGTSPLVAGPDSVDEVRAESPDIAADPPDAADPIRLAAWKEANDPGTSSARLAEIVGDHPEFGPQVWAHPNAYPELKSWIEELARGTD